MESSRGDRGRNEFYQRMGGKIYHSNSKDTSNLKFIETKLKQYDNYFSLNLVVHPMKVF